MAVLSLYAAVAESDEPPHLFLLLLLSFRVREKVREEEKRQGQESVSFIIFVSHAHLSILFGACDGTKIMRRFPFFFKFSVTWTSLITQIIKEKELIQAGPVQKIKKKDTAIHVSHILMAPFKFLDFFCFL